MSILVTGSAGHLGEALMRSFQASGDSAFGVDIKASAFTHRVGSISDADFVSECMQGVSAVIHTATLHKPHVGTHSRQDFIDTNVTGTLNLLEAAAKERVDAFVYTSTTSAFGDAMRHSAGQPAVWVSEDLQSVPKNIYGVSKVAAENLCQLFSRNQSLPCLVLRTSRFFPEEDDSCEQRTNYDDANLKVNELLFRRADIEDIVAAHRLAVEKCYTLKFERFIISATPPFAAADVADLGSDAAAVVARYVPEYLPEYERRGWCMLPSIGRVYDNQRARQLLSWEPRYTFAYALACLADDRDYRSPLTHEIGIKRYHDRHFEDGPYPLEQSAVDNNRF